jgi:hypothetical protein
LRKYPIPPPRNRRGKFHGNRQRWYPGEYKGQSFLRTLWGRIIVTAGLGLALFFASDGLSSVSRILTSSRNDGAACDVKGNISASGEKIYHVPGQKYYGATRINPLGGERWFCSEAEARNAGWRRSRV